MTPPKPPSPAEEQAPPPAQPVLPTLSAPEPPAPEPSATRPQLEIDFRTSGIVILALIAVFTVLYLGKELFFPIALAVILKFLFDPVVRWLGRFRVGRPLGAAVVLVGLLTLLGVGGAQLSTPVDDWLGRAPKTLEQAGRRLRTLLRPMEQVNRAAEQVQDVTSPTAGGAQEVVIRGPRFSEQLYGTTTVIVIGLAETLLLLYFLLVSGDLFLLKIIRVLPALGDKKKAVAIARETESSISVYLGTLFLLNLGLGFFVTLVMWALGMPNPVLWGVAAALFEFIPYIGALAMLTILTVVALTTFPELSRALLVPAAYASVNLVQSNLVSPLLLAKRLTLNPVALFVGLLFWYWIWGVAGAFLAVPMLAALKIICDHVESLAPVGEFLGN